jgi:FkbM family methyltransferase
LALAVVALVTGGAIVYANSDALNLSATVERIAEDQFALPIDINARDTDFVTDYFGRRYQGNTRNIIDANILYYGAWEKWILYFLRDTAAALEKPDLVFVDVGANSGLHSIYMSDYVKAVHSIEPYPPAVDRISDSIERNEIQNIFIHPVGLGSENATLPFAPPTDRNFGVGSFTEGQNADTLQLSIVRADDYFPSNGIDSIDLMKIDIEGYERAALEGMRGELERNRPILVMEVTIHPGKQGLFSSMEDLRAAFPHDYAFFMFESSSRMSGSYKLKPMDVDFQVSDQYDLIVVPAEKVPAVPMERDYTQEVRNFRDSARRNVVH